VIADVVAASFAVKRRWLAAVPTPLTAGEKDMSNDGPMPLKSVFVGCVATELSCRVTTVSPLSEPQGSCAVSTGSEIVPPAEAVLAESHWQLFPR